MGIGTVRGQEDEPLLGADPEVVVNEVEDQDVGKHAHNSVFKHGSTWLLSASGTLNDATAEKRHLGES